MSKKNCTAFLFIHNLGTVLIKQIFCKKFYFPKKITASTINSNMYTKNLQKVENYPENIP